MAQITAYYPSGNWFTFTGKYVGFLGLDADAIEEQKPMAALSVFFEIDKDQRIHGKKVPARAYFACDPRGYYLSDGVCVYDPLDNIQYLHSCWVEWLVDNPDWPHRTLQGKLHETSA